MKRLTLRLDEDLFKSIEEHCSKQGLKQNEGLVQLLQNALNDKNSIVVSDNSFQWLSKKDFDTNAAGEKLIQWAIKRELSQELPPKQPRQIEEPPPNKKQRPTVEEWLNLPKWTHNSRIAYNQALIPVEIIEAAQKEDKNCIVCGKLIIDYDRDDERHEKCLHCVYGGK